MLQEINLLTLEGWPQILSHFLRKSETSEVDRIYQSDVLWFDNNYEKKNFEHNPGQYAFFQIGKHSYIDQSIIGSDKESSVENSIDQRLNESENENEKTYQSVTLTEKERKDLEKAFKSLLDSCELLEDKILTMSNKETWMDRSFDFKLSGGNKSLIQHMEEQAPLPPRSNFAPKKTKKNDISVASSSFVRETSQKLKDTYNNNTILNQFAPMAVGNTEVDETNELYQSILKYKGVTNLIEKHLQQKSNVFHQILSHFESYFVSSYSRVIDSYREQKIDLNTFNTEVIKATLDLQQFVRILYEGINQFYRLRNLKVGKLPFNESLFNRDNVINFITSLVFTDKIYNLIFNLYRQQDTQVEALFQNNVSHCGNLKPDDFAVPEAFCLNETTVEYFKTKNMIPKNYLPGQVKADLKDQQSDDRKKSNGDYSQKREGKSRKVSTNIEGRKVSANIEETKARKLSTNLEEIKARKVSANIEEIKMRKLSNNVEEARIIEEKNSELFMDFDIDNLSFGKSQDYPYRRAISALGTLKHRKSPIHKLKTILKVIELMSISIEDFYKSYGITNIKKLDADQTLSICLYIVAKSGLSDIITHCKIIERFSTSNVLNSVSGYYATTLEACVNCICAMDLQQNITKEDLSTHVKKSMQSLNVIN